MDASTFSAASIGDAADFTAVFDALASRVVAVFVGDASGFMELDGHSNGFVAT